MDEQLRDIYARLESEPLDDEVLRREETREMVGATMSQLPPQYREALEAKYVARRTAKFGGWSIFRRKGAVLG